MRYYLAGPMTYIPQFNFPAFFAAEKELKAMGYDIQLPADMADPVAVQHAMASENGAPGTSSVTWGQCLAKDVELIADHVQGIILMKGWQQSRGARLEAFVGILCNRDFKFYDADAYPPQVRDMTTPEVLREIVDGFGTPK